MGVLLAFGTAISYSVMNLAIRKVGRTHPGETGVLATLIVNLLAFLVLWVVAMATGDLHEIRPDATLAFASIGLTGAFLGRSFLFAGINRIGLVRAGAIKNSSPIVTLILAVVLLGERFTVLATAGILLILFGAFVVVRESLLGARLPAVIGLEAAARSHRTAGVVFALLSGISFGTSNVLSKVGLAIVPDVVQAGTFAACAAVLCYAVAAVVQGRVHAAWRELIAWRPWFWLAGVGATLGQVTFFAALQFIEVGPATVIAATEIILTTALGGLFVQHLEQVTRRIAVPAILVFSGVALIALGR